MAKRKKYRQHLFEKLRDSKAASAYLDEALKDEDTDVFLLAIQDIAEANRNLTTISQSSIDHPNGSCS